MARANWKFRYFSKSLWRKIFQIKKNKKFLKSKKIYDRASTIPSCFKGLIFYVHKGKRFRRLLIHKYNIGYKFGEFGFTRKPFHFPIRRKKNRKTRR